MSLLQVWIKNSLQKVQTFICCCLNPNHSLFEHWRPSWTAPPLGKLLLFFLLFHTTRWQVRDYSNKRKLKCFTWFRSMAGNSWHNLGLLNFFIIQHLTCNFLRDNRQTMLREIFQSCKLLDLLDDCDYRFWLLYWLVCGNFLYEVVKDFNNDIWEHYSLN